VCPCHGSLRRLQTACPRCWSWMTCSTSAQRPAMRLRPHPMRPAPPRWSPGFVTPSGITTPAPTAALPFQVAFTPSICCGLSLPQVLLASSHLLRSCLASRVLGEPCCGHRFRLMGFPRGCCSGGVCHEHHRGGGGRRAARPGLPGPHPHSASAYRRRQSRPIVICLQGSRRRLRRCASPSMSSRVSTSLMNAEPMWGVEVVSVLCKAPAFSAC
jgi:hypothetical protein